MIDTSGLYTKPHYVLFAVLLLGFIGGIQTVDPIIASIALVDAAKSLEFSAETTALASSISTLALAATVIASGLLADRLGRRFVLIVALGTTILGDVLVATSTTSPLYLSGRVMAGIGLGAVFGAAFAYIRAVNPKHIGSALGQFGAMSGITTMLSGLIGGTLVTTSWRLAYLVVPFLCLIGLILIPFILPKVQPIRTGRVDYKGILLIAIGVIGILYGISHASSSIESFSTWIPILLGITSLIIFVFIERASTHPILPLQLFKNKVFVAAAVTVLVWNFSQAIIVLQLSNFWQYMQQYTPTMVTFGLLPMNIIGIIASIWVGKNLAAGKSPGSRIVLGLSFIAAGFFLLAILPHNTVYWMYLPSLFLIGFGLPYAIVPSGQLFMSEAPIDSFGPVTSSKTTIGQFGYSFGLAGSMVVMNIITSSSITDILKKAGIPLSQTGQGLDAVSVYVNTGVNIHSYIAQEALHAAAGSYTHAFSLVMLLTAAIVLLTSLGTYMLLRKTT